MLFRANAETQDALVGIDAALCRSDDRGKWNLLGWPSQFHPFSGSPESSHETGQGEALKNLREIGLWYGCLSRDFVSRGKLSWGLLCQENQRLNGNSS